MTITATSPENAEALKKALAKRQQKVQVVNSISIASRQLQQAEAGVRGVAVPKDIVLRIISQSSDHPTRASGCE